jgi:hypothetical protein
LSFPRELKSLPPHRASEVPVHRASELVSCSIVSVCVKCYETGYNFNEPAK